MYCKKKSGDQYTCKGVIYLHQITVEEVDEVSWKLKRSDKNLVYTFYGKTAKDKQIWTNAIKDLQEKYNSTRVKPPEKKNVQSMVMELNLILFFGKIN